MTNHWIDYQHSDVIMALGVNTAENHPVSMKWIDRARAKGGKFIAVDPRFTRTAAKANLYTRLRPGTDIAFLNGLMNYAIENGLYNKEYVAAYTNGTHLINPGFGFKDGVFSGLQDNPLPWDPDYKTYNKSSWSYQTDAEGNIRTDRNMVNPDCVFQLLKNHVSRYTPETVSEITGMTVQQFLTTAELYCSTGRPGSVGTILYAMGITQHTYGSQNVRAIAMLQLLLGNIGLAGGGVNAQRGESNVQGSTDFAQLFHILPGYLPMISAATHPDFDAYNATTPKTGYWSNRPKFLVSMLKAWFGSNAMRTNDFAFDYLPKLDNRERSHISFFEYMMAGEIAGLFAWGQNPAVGGPNAKRERAALSKLDWLVAIDLWETETAAFWKAPDVDSSAIQTEVFLLPAACSYEKQGSIANSGRWIQWRYEAVHPPGEAKSDLWIADKLFKRIRKLYEQDAGAVFPDPIMNLTWDYGGEGDSEPDIIKVAVEINGYEVGSGRPVLNFTRLTDTGTTACGNWLYSGYYNNLTDPATKRRIKETSGIGGNHDWSFAWPVNRRIIYNRCSARPDGTAWDSRTPVVWWQNGQWQRNDVPDFGWISGTDHIPPEVSARAPFIMTPELKSRLFAGGMADGPFPEHYEPVESPTNNSLSKQQSNPARRMFVSDANRLAAVASSEYPHIASTYRVVEHWQSGIMTRNSPWLNELIPNMFCEISPGLAAQIGVGNGDKVLISSARGEIEAVACVTPRIKPYKVNGRSVELVGMIWHFGFCGKSKGASANDLTPHAGDANTTIPEYKAFLCNVRRAT